MGAMQNNPKGKRNTKGRRQRVHQTADWAAVDPRAIARLVECVVRFDGAVRYGLSSDGGAYAIGIYGDGDKPYTEYIPGSADITTELDRICDEFDAGDGGDASVE